MPENAARAPLFKNNSNENASPATFASDERFDLGPKNFPVFRKATRRLTSDISSLYLEEFCQFQEAPQCIEERRL